MASQASSCVVLCRLEGSLRLHAVRWWLRSGLKTSIGWCLGGRAGICAPKCLGIWRYCMAEARTLASVGLTPANGFSGQTASGSAGVAGVAGSTLEHTAPRRDIWFVYIDKARRNLTAPSPFGADGEGEGRGMQLAGEATNLRRTAP